MKKFKLGMGSIIIILFLVSAISLGLFEVYKGMTGNKDFLKIDYNFKKAVIKLPNNEIVTGEVEEWTTYDSKDTVKVKLKNGKQYLGHSSNIVLYND